MPLKKILVPDGRGNDQMCQLVEETAWHEINENPGLEGNGEDDGEGKAHGPRGNGEGDRGT